VSDGRGVKSVFEAQAKGMLRTFSAVIPIVFGLGDGDVIHAGTRHDERGLLHRSDAKVILNTSQSTKQRQASQFQAVYEASEIFIKSHSVILTASSGCDKNT